MAVARDRFPSAGEFPIHSHPIFMLYRGDESELLVFDANMRVRTGEPHTLASQKRRVPVEVVEWVAKATSRLLGQQIELRLAKGEQPRSRVIAQESRSDFPGELEFNMNWELRVGGTAVMDGLEGRASGTISAFPPKGDIFHITGKTVEFQGVRVQPVACACTSVSFFSVEPSR